MSPQKVDTKTQPFRPGRRPQCTGIYQGVEMKVLTKLAAGAATVVVAVAGTTLAADALTVAQNKAAQTRLNALGCYAGPVDGKIGQMTQAATIRFQAANKMTQNGSLA